MKQPLINRDKKLGKILRCPGPVKNRQGHFFRAQREKIELQIILPSEVVPDWYGTAQDMIEEVERIRRRQNPPYRSIEDVAEEKRTKRTTGCVDCRIA